MAGEQVGSGKPKRWLDAWQTSQVCERKSAARNAN
jgi:hypothetical protein